MKVKVKKHGFFCLPILADVEAYNYCNNCYEILIFDRPAAAGTCELICPVCGQKVLYRVKEK